MQYEYTRYFVTSKRLRVHKKIVGKLLRRLYPGGKFMEGSQISSGGPQVLSQS